MYHIQIDDAYVCVYKRVCSHLQYFWMTVPQTGKKKVGGASSGGHVRLQPIQIKGLVFLLKQN